MNLFVTVLIDWTLRMNVFVTFATDCWAAWLEWICSLLCRQAGYCVTRKNCWRNLGWPMSMTCLISSASFVFFFGSSFRITSKNSKYQLPSERCIYIDLSRITWRDRCTVIHHTVHSPQYRTDATDPNTSTYWGQELLPTRAVITFLTSSITHLVIDSLCSRLMALQEYTI